MNWKTVTHLIRVDMKSGRLIRGQRLIRYRERRLFDYVVYGGALVLGLAVGALAIVIVRASSELIAQSPISLSQALLSLFVALPTLVVIYSLVLTMMQQIQRSGIKFSSQAPYWLPITWEEHTLASVLANLLGFPLASILFISSAIILFSAFFGQISLAIGTVLVMLAAAFMASAITEIFRVLQVRFIGAVYRSTGRAAVWIRFVGLLLFFIVFYVAYFYVISGTGVTTFIQTVASVQSSAWYIPFVWLGMILYSLSNGFFLQGFGFLVASLLFIVGVFYLAVLLNRRFGLYEPPAITISSGVYAPKTGLLGRLGFSTVEAALIKKDFKAFTRRRELITVFIVPIVIILLPLMQSLGTMERPVPGEAALPLFALVFLFPAIVMAVSLGNFIIGEEGAAIWRIYASPVSAKSLVKSKYFFIVFFSIVVMAVTGTVSVVVFHPSTRAALTALIESLLLVFALSAVSLSNGIKGADFTELPRPRMIRPLWAFVNLIECFLSAVVILGPILAYEIARFLSFLSLKPLLELYQAVILSAIVTAVITFVMYRLSVRNARKLLSTAEL